MLPNRSAERDTRLEFVVLVFTKGKPKNLHGTESFLVLRVHFLWGTLGLQSAEKKTLNLKELVLSWQRTSTSWKRRLPLLSLVRKPEPLPVHGARLLFPIILILRCIWSRIGVDDHQDDHMIATHLLLPEGLGSSDELSEMLRWTHTDARN